MKIGDFVKIKKPKFINKIDGPGRMQEGKSGIIIDCLEMSDGFWEFEVLIGHEVDWFNDLELEVLSEV